MAFQRINQSKRAMILAALCEGSAINSICRMFGVGKHAVLRVVEETGEACADWHDKHFRNLTVERLELDEQWSYVHTHRERMSKEDKYRHPERGDSWLWASIDADSKAIINWQTSKRSLPAAREFAHDLASRINGRVQITSDQLQSYGYAIPGAFKDRVDFAQETKVFQNINVTGPEYQKYRVNPLVGVERQAVMGNPNLSTATVCHIERFFLTVRQGNKRCARKTLAYSKSWENHAAMASIQCTVYNLCRKHEGLKTTPAVALGVVARRWSLEDVVAMADEYFRLKDEREFEAAFTKFAIKPKAARTFEPTPKDKIPLPWYLDPNSGGPPSEKP